MKRVFLATFCLLLMVTAEAQEKKPLRGFDGGMMVHTGPVSGSDYGGLHIVISAINKDKDTWTLTPAMP